MLTWETTSRACILCDYCCCCCHANIQCCICIFVHKLPLLKNETFLTDFKLDVCKYLILIEVSLVINVLEDAWKNVKKSSFHKSFKKRLRILKKVSFIYYAWIFYPQKSFELMIFPSYLNSHCFENSQFFENSHFFKIDFCPKFIFFQKSHFLLNSKYFPKFTFFSKIHIFFQKFTFF